MEATARFNGQVVLVTGGTGALGSAVARAFLQEGASVAVTYRTPQEYEILQSSLAADAVRLRGHPTDVTNEAQMLRTTAAIEEEFHRLDGLVNMVGGWTGGTKLWEAESATLERMLSLNLRSAFVGARAVVPMLLRQGRGYLVNVAARAAVWTRRRVPERTRRPRRPQWHSCILLRWSCRAPASASIPYCPTSSTRRRIGATCHAPISAPGPSRKRSPA